ncbi:MAG: acyl-CoA thioesterase, partial [Acidimicrobiia bacterium]
RVMADPITLQRRVQWMDTDAAGIWHHSVVLRWFEEAEAELHRRLGIIDQTFGSTPRVRTEFTFSTQVRFDDLVDISLRVISLGKTSITYELDVECGADRVAQGRVVAVFIDRETGEKRAWTETLRQALEQPK